MTRHTVRKRQKGCPRLHRPKAQLLRNAFIDGGYLDLAGTKTGKRPARVAEHARCTNTPLMGMCEGESRLDDTGTFRIKAGRWVVQVVRWQVSVSSFGRLSQMYDLDSLA